MKDWCVKLLSGGLLLLPISVQSQTRVCVINECYRYTDNVNAFLRLQSNSSKTYDLTYGENYSELTRKYMPIENLLYNKASKIAGEKKDIKNIHAADIVTRQAASRLKEKGYDTVTPTASELDSLWKLFGKKDFKTVGNEHFHKYLCDTYKADMLIVLTESPFDLVIHTSKKREKGQGKVVDADMSLSCVNSWSVFNPGKGNNSHTFQTDGSSNISWIDISRKQLRYRTFTKHTDVPNIPSPYSARIESEGNTTIMGKWGFYPIILHAATEAAQFFEQNL